MISATCKLDQQLNAEVENILFEIAPSNWSIAKNRKTKISTLSGNFNNIVEATDASLLLQSYIGKKIDFIFEELSEGSWKNAYRHHFKVWRYKNFVFVPFWEKEGLRLKDGEQAIFIDPAMAFGTGTHETTRLCLQFLIDYFSNNNNPIGSLIDIGCGSGILAITAKLLGFSKVHGIDNDRDAIENSLLNAKNNGLESKIVFQKEDLNSLTLYTYGCVVANIQSDILIEYSDKIINSVDKTDGVLILSGILNYEIEDVTKHFQKLLNERKLKFSLNKNEKGEWAAILINFNK